MVNITYYIVHTSVYTHPSSFVGGAGLEVRLFNIASVGSFPRGTFTSSRLVAIANSSVDTVDTGAFSGNQMLAVELRNVTVGRVESSAFSSRTYIRQLNITNTTVMSMAEKAIESGISQLTVDGTVLASMSPGAVNIQVARALFVNSTIRTLKNASLVLSAWDLVIFKSNRFDFCDDGAFYGISSPAGGAETASLVFAHNLITYANGGALRLALKAGEARLDVEGNTFGRSCSCDMAQWLRLVCGVGRRNQEDGFYAALYNTSLCSLDERARKCFNGEATVSFEDYHSAACAVSLDHVQGEVNRLSLGKAT
jgi:hypothetical protein